jgi:hypothetical protein
MKQRKRSDRSSFLMENAEQKSDLEIRPFVLVPQHLVYICNCNINVIAGQLFTIVFHLHGCFRQLRVVGANDGLQQFPDCCWPHLRAE